MTVRFTNRLLASLLLIILALVLPRPASADGPPPEWVVIAGGVRITFYGPRYIGDGTERMASGAVYRRGSADVSLGPSLLRLVRDHYRREAGHPLIWGWGPGLEFWYVGVGSCHFVPITLDEARLWGCGARVCAETASGGRSCQEVRVMDSGGRDPDNGIELGIDLPDWTWGTWGYAPETGVFTGTLEAVVWR